MSKSSSGKLMAVAKRPGNIILDLEFSLVHGVYG